MKLFQFIVLILFAFLTFAVDDSIILDKHLEDLVSSLERSFKINRIKSIAIIPFENVSDDSKKFNIGITVTEYLHGRINENTVKIVERGQLNRVLEELNLNLTGLIAADKAKEAGKLISADAVICGSITEIGNYFDINLRLIDVEKGKIVSSELVEIKKEIFIGKEYKNSNDIEKVQSGINALQIAIDLYGGSNVKDFTITYPEKLKEMVPDYIDRIPDPMKGKWLYNNKSGKVSHSVFTQLLPINPRINSQTFLNMAAKAQVKSTLMNLRIYFLNEFVNTGEFPKDMKKLIKEALPFNEKMDKWIYDPKERSVRHVKFKTPKMIFTEDGDFELIE